MSLINRYIAEVGRHLPEKDRSDIEAEIRSTLEDMLEGARVERLALEVGGHEVLADPALRRLADHGERMRPLRGARLVDQPDERSGERQPRQAEQARQEQQVARAVASHEASLARRYRKRCRTTRSACSTQRCNDRPTPRPQPRGWV